MDISEIRALIASAPPEVQRSFVALNGWLEDNCEECKEPSGVVASTTEIPPFPVDPFANPNFSSPTPLTITSDGRIFGHAAAWDSCHVGSPDGAGKCTPPPRSKSDYAYFKTGVFTNPLTNTETPVGTITFNANHASLQADINGTRDHYAHTGTQAAYVNVGEDDHGIWMAGMLNPDLTDSDIRALKAAAISGDWRPIDNNRELIAALAVNVPGFPIPRPQALVASGEITAQIAANIVPQHEPWMEGVDELRKELATFRDMLAPIQASALKSQVPDYTAEEQAQLTLMAQALQLQSQLGN